MHARRDDWNCKLGIEYHFVQCSEDAFLVRWFALVWTLYFSCGSLYAVFFYSAAMNINPVEQLEKDREDQERKLKKMEKEMEQVFEMKVKEKKKKLKDTEGEVTMTFFRKSKHCA